jgi:hypothetical protein
MEWLKDSPHFGIASDHEGMFSLSCLSSFHSTAPTTDGRQQAIEFLHKVQQSVHQLNSRLHRKAVVAVQIHSAPKQNPQAQVCHQQNVPVIN